MIMRRSLSSTVGLQVVICLLALGGCSSSHMLDVASRETDYTIRADRALLVFMRPVGYGGAIQSSVFDVTDGEPLLLGIVSAKTKIAHYAEPGERLFMVIGENADFMAATLDPGKVYYALVEPRVGLWKARFGLRPVHPSRASPSQSAYWWNETRWVESGATASTWAIQNMESIRGKMADYLPEWQKQADKPTLAAQDGEETLFDPITAQADLTQLTREEAVEITRQIEASVDRDSITFLKERKAFPSDWRAISLASWYITSLSKDTFTVDLFYRFNTPSGEISDVFSLRGHIDGEDVSYTEVLASNGVSAQ